MRLGALLAVIATYALLSVLAWQSDVTEYGHSSLVATDVAAGLSFGLAAALARGAEAERWLVSAVGLSWLAGSVWDWAVSLHQGALIVMLAAFPTGRLRSKLVGTALLSAVLVTVLAPGPQVVGLLFAAEAAAVVGINASSSLPRRAYPSGSALLLAAVLAHAWWLTHQAQPAEPRLYEAVVALVALAFAAATRLARWTSTGLTDLAVGLDSAGDLPGLQTVLRGLFRDNELALVEGNAGSGRHIRWQGEVVATLHTSSASLDDPLVAEAVDAAIQLTIEHARLRAVDAARIAELEASRARLQKAVDAERADVSAKLAHRVGAHLELADAQLATGSQTADSELRELLDTAAEALREASAEVFRIVHGAPPVELGGGMLVGALQRMAEDCPVRTQVVGELTATAEIETTLFYIAREAVANAVKHAEATSITIQLGALEQGWGLSVVDDGRGGANLAGSGLLGLTDRAAVIAATVTLESPSDVGTAITVTVPQALAVTPVPS